jgi:nucleoside-diphosphate-sugar epimerase
MTKQDTEIASERESLRMLAEAQQRIAAACEQHGIRWTILQPTLIYKEGRDTNFTSLSRLIRRFGFMPRSAADRVCGNAEDLAIGAIAAAPAAVNQFYSLLGAETISYRETIGRIFDGLRLPRRMILVPPVLWRMAFALAQP